MRLNIGSGTSKNSNKKEIINLDIIKQANVDVVGSGTKLPFKDNSINIIHCIHVLEHVQRHLNSTMLKEMHRVLKPRGEVWIEVPDFEQIVFKLAHAFWNENDREIHVWTTSIYGKNENPGMAHHWGFSEKLLTGKMRNAGFVEPERMTEMISNHYLMEPVILMRGVK